MKVLIVDSSAECAQLSTRLSSIAEVRQCDTATSIAQARSSLGESTDLMFVDMHLEDGSALRVIEAAFALRSAPTIVATGQNVDSSLVFQAARAGVHTFLPKPYDDERLCACIDGTQDAFAPMAAILRPLVGHFGMKDIQSEVRRILVREALARTNGSRASAARVLQVTRPAVQKYLRTAGNP